MFLDSFRSLDSSEWVYKKHDHKPMFNHLLFKKQQKNKIGFKDKGMMNPVGKKNPEFKISS